MKKCFDCGAECQPDARFCPQCGRNFRAAKGGRGRKPPEAASPRGGGYPHSESIDAWEELKASKRNRAMWIFAVGAGLTAVATASVGFEAAPFGGVLTLIVIMLSMRVSASNYYSIPHSNDAEGEHRCIFCGNRGIWRKGIYRTNDKIANCSKCKAQLFYE
ncbi:zinc ribbon domain-containing protein [Archangium gephyra]|uniref:hypothetical protein n=1 Tax=Archangium gephyra TaxID=48 RepID=UPI0035D46C20